MIDRGKPGRFLIPNVNAKVVKLYIFSPGATVWILPIWIWPEVVQRELGPADHG